MRKFGCTPSQAAAELDGNPELPEIITAALYEDTYEAVKEWDALDRDGRKGRTEPKGRMVELVRNTAARAVAAEMDANDQALEAEGRA